MNFSSKFLSDEIYCEFEKSIASIELERFENSKPVVKVAYSLLTP